MSDISEINNLCVDLIEVGAQAPATPGMFAVPCTLSREQLRAAILQMEAGAREAQESGAELAVDIADLLPLTHFFAPGAYARQALLQKHTWVIGKLHRHAHLNFVMKGRVMVVTEDGPMIIQAPHTFVSTVGTKRFVLVLEEAIWVTVHPTEETDLAKIEDHVIAKGYDDIGIIENNIEEVNP